MKNYILEKTNISVLTMVLLLAGQSHAAIKKPASIEKKSQAFVECQVRATTRTSPFVIESEDYKIKPNINESGTASQSLETRLLGSFDIYFQVQNENLLMIEVAGEQITGHGKGSAVQIQSQNKRIQLSCKVRN